VATSLIGQNLGKYKIVSLLGHGGMATVYKGHQADVDRFVAIKVLPPHPGRDPQFTERFNLEARTIARLQHPHILPLYDYGVQDDILYLVVALVETGSLNDRIRRGALPQKEVERLLQQIASAMDYAHRQGIVHRDIKPDNILIDSEGYPLLADFGIAKMVEGDSRLTASGSLLGTPAYMSPEQGQGLAAGSLSDIYSLGVVVYEMLTGRQPFTADTAMQIVMKHLTEPLPRVQEFAPDLPLTVDEVLRCAMAKKAENRYPSAASFAEDLSRALRGSSPLLGQETEGSTTLLFDAPTQLGESSTQSPTASAPVATTGQTTMASSPGVNLYLLLGAATVIIVLVIAVLLLAFGRNDGGTTTADPTNTAVASNPTEVAQVVPNATRIPTFGQLRFTTVDALGDTVNMQVENLTPPTAGHHYAAWLVNPAGDALLLGSLRLDSLGNGILTYTDSEGRVLPALFSGVLLTQEETVGDAPAGDALYSGSVPDEVAQAISEIFIASPEGIHGGSLLDTYTEDGGEIGTASGEGSDGGSLLEGLIAEATIGQQHAGLASSSDSVGGLHTHAEHTINILLGTHDDLNGDGSPQNPGHGEGVRLFLERIESRLDAIQNLPSASRTLQSQIELMRICAENTRNRMNQIVDLERELLASDSVEAVDPQADQAQALATELIEGADLNNNDQIEPFEGECGINQIPSFGVLIGNMDIIRGGLTGGV
jgi:tRNA A-37 threonylcarbamoyl transferase component Bud32